MLEINVVVCTVDSSSVIPDGRLYWWYNNMLKKDQESKSAIIINVIVTGYVQMMLLIAKDYKKEIKIHQITEFDDKGEKVGIHNKVNGQWNIENIKSLNILETILWEML